MQPGQYLSSFLLLYTVATIITSVTWALLPNYLTLVDSICASTQALKQSYCSYKALKPFRLLGGAAFHPMCICASTQALKQSYSSFVTCIVLQTCVLQIDWMFSAAYINTRKSQIYRLSSQMHLESCTWKGMYLVFLLACQCQSSLW